MNFWLDASSGMNHLAMKDKCKKGIMWTTKAISVNRAEVFVHGPPTLEQLIHYTITFEFDGLCQIVCSLEISSLTKQPRKRREENKSCRHMQASHIHHNRQAMIAQSEPECFLFSPHQNRNPIPNANTIHRPIESRDIGAHHYSHVLVKRYFKYLVLHKRNKYHVKTKEYTYFWKWTNPSIDFFLLCTPPSVKKKLNQVQ